MGGGMEVNRNRWIEEWGADRENLELKFRFTRRSLAIIGIFGLAVPILVYKGIVKQPPTPRRPSRPISAQISFPLSPNPKPNLSVWLEMDAAYAGRGRRPAGPTGSSCEPRLRWDFENRTSVREMESPFGLFPCCCNQIGVFWNSQVVWYLQGLAFRGHDESINSKNKGNFKEMLEWYTKKDPKAEKLIGDAGENHKLTSPEIQLDLKV